MTVSKEVMARVLTAFLALAIEDKELFHPKDIEMVQSNDWWIERFFANNRTEEEATRALINTMEWRKDFGVHNLTENEFTDIKESGIHLYDQKDKEGRPVLWNRFALYKRGVWSTELSKRFLIYTYETLDKKAGRNGWSMVGDGEAVLPSNVNIELVNFLVEVVDKHYPLSVVKGSCTDFPPFFVDVIKELINGMSTWASHRVFFIKGPELLKSINQEQLPAYKLKSLAAAKL